MLSNQLEPVQGDDFSDDGLSSFNIIFIFTFFIAMFASDDCFLAGQCLYRMTRSLQRPLLVQFFQRMVMVHDETFTGFFSGSSELCWKMYQLKQMAVVIKTVQTAELAESKCLNKQFGANVME